MKELWMESVDELVEMYLDQGIDEEEAYKRAEARAYNHMVDKLADRADMLRDREREYG